MINNITPPPGPLAVQGPEAVRASLQERERIWHDQHERWLQSRHETYINVTNLEASKLAIRDLVVLDALRGLAIAIAKGARNEK